MKVFSKRYIRGEFRIPLNRQINGARQVTIPSERYSRKRFLTNELRTRLSHYLRFITSSDAYLEPFLLVRDDDEGSFELNTRTLRDFSAAEIGYDITSYIDNSTLEVMTPDEDGDREHDDYPFFDLIEILIVFSKNEVRATVVERINTIFDDDNAQFKIHEWMIIAISLGGISTLLPLIKSKTLKDRLSATRAVTYGNSQAKARSAADALQYIFSAEKKGSSKTASEAILSVISERWTEKEKEIELQTMLNDLVLIIKRFNNEIANIRHTDKHTIAVEGPGIFDMIYKLNMSVIELALVTEQDKYIEDTTAEEIKQLYSSDYNVNITESFRKKSSTDEPIDLSEIPF